MIKSSPTVLPKDNFSAEEDAKILHNVLDNDANSLIDLLTKRSLAQRLQIRALFQQIYNKNVLDEIENALNGDFQKLVEALLTPRTLFFAQELKHAMEGFGTDEDTLIEILCTLSNAEITDIKQTYERTYNTSLESDIKGDTSGYFRRLLLSLCSAQRDESSAIDLEAARRDAQSLYNAGEKRWGTDDATFNRILCYTNYAQLRLIFDEYEKLTGNNIEKAIKSEFSGDGKDGLVSLVRCVHNKPKFFAKELINSMKGLSTNDRKLIRIIVTRCEIDMEDIKKEYSNQFATSLVEEIKDECSGDYKHCLLALIGGL